MRGERLLFRTARPAGCEKRGLASEAGFQPAQAVDEATRNASALPLEGRPKHPGLRGLKARSTRCAAVPPLKLVTESGVP